MRRSGWTKWLIVIPGNARHCVGDLCAVYNGYLGIWCIYLPADCNFGIGLWSANCDAGTE